jgi:hypothetical protein
MSKKMDTNRLFQLITECRQSGLTDRQWCIEQGLSPSTFYNWIKRLLKSSSVELPPSIAKYEPQPLLRQEVIKVNVIPDTKVLQLPSETHSDAPIEILFSGIQIRIRNNADAGLIADTVKALRHIC